MDDTLDCRICLNAEPKINGWYKIKECGHTFHADCFFEWCKQGVFSCPLCRSTPEDNLNFMDKKQKLSYLKKVSLRKHSPPILKELGEKYRSDEKRFKELKAEFRKFRKENKTVLDTLNKKQTNIFNQRTKCCRSKDCLLGFPVLELPKNLRLSK